ncbi:MAG TPA: MMPL family transporter [Candidatus Saccharimonadales bacterium]
MHKHNLAYKKPSVWLRVMLPIALVITWLAVSAIGGPYFGKISDVSSTDLTTFLPKTAESTKVNDTLTKFQDSKTIPLVIVFDNNDTKLTSANIEAVKAAGVKLEAVRGVVGKISAPITSADSKAAFVVVPLSTGGDFEKIFSDTKRELTAGNLGMRFTLAGPASFSHDLQGAFSGIDGTLLLVALAVVFVILLIVYRSPFLPVIVLVSAMAALSAAILVVWNLAKAGTVQLNGQVQGILFILVIGAATDYSLLYIARYREELTRFEKPWQAAWEALKAAFEPILAAAGTVVAGLLCLLFSDLGSDKALGPVGGIGIGFALLSALTFLPAVLVLCGRGAFWPRKPKYEPELRDNYEHRHPAWTKIGTLVRRHPRRIWVGSAVLLLAACAGIVQLKADGVPQSDLIMGTSEAKDGQAILDKHFPGGSGSPAYVLADATKQTQLVVAIEADKGVDSVYAAASGVESGTAPLGATEQTIKNEVLKQVEIQRAAQLAALQASIAVQLKGMPPQVVASAYQQASAQVPSAETIAGNAYPFKDAKVKVVDGNELLQVTLKDSADSFAARDTIVRLREAVKKIDSSAMIGGMSAIQYDTNNEAIRDRTVLIPLILAVITVILMLLLRSIVAPLVLLITTLASFGATMGISALLFNHVWHFAGADPSVVIYGFVFLVALGIDYNIFLMTRVREETLKLGVREGTIKGLVVTGGVITSAGVVLAATFAALGVIPVSFLVQIAFIVAFGVLLDTILVRSLFVPALTLQIGRPMWWPSLKNKSPPKE